MILALVALACAPREPGESGGARDTGADPSDTSTGPTDTGTPWEPAAPSWDAAGVAEHLDAALSPGLPDPASLIAAFEAIVAAGGTEGCPNYHDLNMNAPINGCVAPSGYLYAGLVMYAPTEGATDSFELSGDAYVNDPQQRTFQLAGKIVQAVDDAAWSLEWDGTWGYPGADGWLIGVPSAALLVTHDGDGTTLRGGYGVGEDAAYFHDVTVDGAGAPTGALGLRDPAGSWYTLTFAGSADGCGTVEYAGAALGEACVPLGAVTADLVSRMPGGA